MRKKILVTAVAGALAAPALVFAQYQDRAQAHPTERSATPDASAGSSVTISGAFRVTVNRLSVGNANAAIRTNTNETRVLDESSSLVFSVKENLGSGLAAVARYDLRPSMTTGAFAPLADTWVGLDSKVWGSLTVGRHSLHYFKTPEDAYSRGAGYRFAPSALMDFAGAGRVAIANATRTPNTIKYTTPTWNGLATVVAYSASPTGAGSASADMTTGNSARDGRAWNVNPTYSAGNWAAGYSFWDSKTDAPSAVFNSAIQGIGNIGGLAPSTTAPSAVGQLGSADQRSNTLYGHYMWSSGWKLGLSWNKSKLTAAATAAGLAPTGTELSNRTVWAIPLRYETGPHAFMAVYTKAQDDSATAVQDGAKMVALTYGYALSKRTNVALQWARLTNDGGAAYTPYASGSVNSGLAPGESTSNISLGINHTF